MTPERFQELCDVYANLGQFPAAAEADALELLKEVERLNRLLSDSFRIVEALHRKLNEEDVA